MFARQVLTYIEDWAETDTEDGNIDRLGDEAERLLALIGHNDGVPGWKLVPGELTDEMLAAGQRAWLDDPLQRSSTLYRAMIAAAPQPKDQTP